MNELLDIELLECDYRRIEECKSKINKSHRVYSIIEELYILTQKRELSTSDIADIYNVSTRMVQLWLKEIGLNRTLKEAKKVSMNKKQGKFNDIDFKEINSNVSTEKFYLPIDDIVNDNIKQGNKWLYIFKHKGIVLYVGKCEGSVREAKRKDGYTETKEYNLRGRMIAHFTSGGKHLPQYVYDLTDTILYADISNVDDVLKLENALIFRYKIDNQCLFNKSMEFEVNQNIDNIYFKLYNVREVNANDIDMPNVVRGYLDKMLNILATRNFRM